MFVMTAPTETSPCRPGTSPLFAHLSADEWQVVQAYGQTTTAPAGTLLCACGAQAEGLYLVQSGSLLAGPTRIAAGQVAGETALLDGTPSDTSLTTETYAEVWSLRPRQFDSLLQEHPRIAGKVALGLARHVSRRSRLATPAVPPTAAPSPAPFHARSLADLAWA